MQLNEDSLKAGDLKFLVDDIFEVDNYKSKMGEDKDVVVLAFTVEDRGPAEDMVNFIERGYQFVLDADMTPGELSDGKYRVFVEIERNAKIAENIHDMLYGLKKLTSINEFKFRYHKSFDTKFADTAQLAEAIPNDPLTYDTQLAEYRMESYDHFFAKTMVESVSYKNNILEFKKVYAAPIKFRYIASGKTAAVLESIEDRISVGMNDMADIMFLTKYIGNYNITKLGNRYMFENKNYAVLLEKI
jgi:multimeric flavodoxin WrbA